MIVSFLIFVGILVTGTTDLLRLVGWRNGPKDYLIRKRITQIVVKYSSLITKSTIQHAMKLSTRALRNIAESR